MNFTFVLKIYEVEDCYKLGISNSDTWHNIQSSGSISVSNGTATGRNKVMDYGWDNNSDWELTFTFAENNNYGGFIVTDTTNTSSYDRYCVKITRGDSGLIVEAYTTSKIKSQNFGSVREYDYKIQNINSTVYVYYKLSSATEYTLITSFESPFSTNTCSCGLFTWVSANGYFKNLKVKQL